MVCFLVLWDLTSCSTISTVSKSENAADPTTLLTNVVAVEYFHLQLQSDLLVYGLADIVNPVANLYILSRLSFISA